MATVQFSAVLVCCAYFLSSSSASHSHQQELQFHNEHLNYIADFPCLHPQPRVLSVHKLFSESQMNGKAYYPTVTVLHRCDECTGSCTLGHTCAAKMSELVKLPFKTTFMEDRGKFKKGDWQMEVHEMVNHTECACAVPPPQSNTESTAKDSLWSRAKKKVKSIFE